MEDITEELEEIIYTATDMQIFSNKEKFELKLLEKGRFLLPGYFLVLGVWLYKEINEIFIYYFVIRDKKLEKRFGLNDPLKISEIGEENFLKTKLIMQVLEFQVLDFIAFQYDFNHDGNNEILLFSQDYITGYIHCIIYVVNNHLELKKALDISAFPDFSIYPEFINYKCRQGIKFFDGEEYVFYYYDRLQQKYVQDENAASEELEQIHGSPDFFAEAGIDYTKLARPLVPADLEGFSKPALRIWRNAVYAMHGRKFASEDLQALFNEYVWYKPDEEYSDDKLTEIDRANIRLIKEFEKK